MQIRSEKDIVEKLLSIQHDWNDLWYLTVCELIRSDLVVGINPGPLASKIRHKHRQTRQCC